jgi:iron complex outermembrane recepter protein
MKVRFIRRYAWVLTCVAPALANAQTLADAQTKIPELNAITVTASRVPVDGRTQAVSIPVISAADIAASSARTLQDLLSTQSGISVINTTCSSDNAIVDLRGFGMTGASNTLIMIDGVRKNDNDLSAPSLGVIPLSQVERVEIVRGSGSVQYGGGTTGGVINVISKKYQDEPVAASATVKAGNYGLRQTDASIALNNEHVSVNAFMQSLHTDNYRENNKKRREGGGAGVGFRHEGGSLYFYGRSTSQSLGLPGPRRIDPFTGVNEFADDPRGATYLSDYLKVRFEAFGMQFEQRLRAGVLFADINQRDKDLDGYSLSAYDEIRRKQDLDEHTLNRYSFISDAVELCGGVNIFADGTVLVPQVTLESVLAAKPEAILSGVSSAAEATAHQQDWRSYGLAATQDTHLIQLDADSLYRPGPHLIDATEQLCTALNVIRETRERRGL